MMENMMVMMKKQETQLENIKSTLNDVKQRIQIETFIGNKKLAKK